MPTLHRLTATLAATATTMMVMATPAAAQTRTMHRGVDGCISWSWDDGGWTTTTVYLHNQCDTPRWAYIAWKWNGLERSEIRLAADEKAHQARRSEPKEIYDGGAA
ncbi:hypothetical protein ACFVXQ_05365 [Kitasatospora sp. NPDC058263]